MNRLLVTTALLSACAIASAEGQLRLRPGMTGVADIGASDCAMFNEMHYNGPTGMRQHVLTWVQGYVYARTGANIDTLLAQLPDNNGWDFDSLTDIFVNYCADKPDAKVAEAAVSLWVALEAGKSAPTG